MRSPSRARPWARAARTIGALVVLVAPTLISAGCDRASSAASADATGATAQGAGDRAGESAWDDAGAGPVLIVDGGNETEAAIVLPHANDSTLGQGPPPDTASLHGAHLDLFSRGGPAGHAVLMPTTAGTLTGDCTAWPAARVESLDQAGAAPGPWAVALTAGHAVSLPLDSVQALAPADSARRAADVVRVAASLAGDTAAAFRALPFVVRRAGRGVLDDGTALIAAEIVRRVNEEATPREEHILLVIERDTVTGRSVAAYSERVSGPEDDVESSEFLAALHLSARRTPVLVVSRDYGDGGAYSLLERTAPGHWRVRWSSAYTGC